MKRILFYDNSVLDYFTKHNNPALIIDYFDIEVQKIIHVIGFSYKNKPQLILSKHAIKNIPSSIDYICDLSSLDFSKNPGELCKMPCCGIIFDCYL